MYVNAAGRRQKAVLELCSCKHRYYEKCNTLNLYGDMENVILMIHRTIKNLKGVCFNTPVQIFLFSFSLNCRDDNHSYHEGYKCLKGV